MLTCEKEEEEEEKSLRSCSKSLARQTEIIILLYDSTMPDLM